jgi:hypothetical protein
VQNSFVLSETVNFSSCVYLSSIPLRTLIVNNALAFQVLKPPPSFQSHQVEIRSLDKLKCSGGFTVANDQPPWTPEPMEADGDGRPLKPDPLRFFETQQ